MLGNFLLLILFIVVYGLTISYLISKFKNKSEAEILYFERQLDRIFIVLTTVLICYTIYVIIKELYFIWN